MIILRGKSVFPGIGIGKIVFYRKKELSIRRYAVDDQAAELKRFELAKEEAVRQLSELEKTARERAGAENAAIFEIHKMLLLDEEYCANIRNMILSGKVNAEYAVSVTADHFHGMFHSMKDEYMSERAADVEDISDRLLDILTGAVQEKWCLKEPSIIAADDLTPSETIQLPPEMLLGFLMRRGSLNSHTAILSRSMGIPALVDVGEQLSEEYDGKLAVIDGGEGAAYICPEEMLLAGKREKKEQEKRRRDELLSLKGEKNITLDGHQIKLYANAGSLEDVYKAKENDAGGIGLLRSEILFLEGQEAPDEEKQFIFYRSILEAMEGREVVIRTMDIGADKQVPYLNLEPEANPALGYRAIRIGLTRPKLLKTQLKALYRAGRFGKLSIMYPMITSAEEMRRIRLLEKEAKEELLERGEQVPDRIPTGIMIETPAAALISDELALMADFFSVGTNDLTQYTLAVDRQNARLDEFCNIHHPAVLKLIQMTAQNAKAAGIWIGICGELATDAQLTETFLKMGIDELSVAPGMVLELRRRIRELDLSNQDEESETR